MYRKNYPKSEIRDLWKVVGPFHEDKEWGLEVYLRCIARLAKPITYSKLAIDRVTRHLGVVRKKFFGKTDITEDWPLLYEKIVSLNPTAKKALREWHFD
jgi:hypothetical protein